MATKKRYTTGNIMFIAYTLFFKVGFYPIEWKEWRHKGAPKKTWTRFKINFDRAFKKVREEHANSGTQAYTENVEIHGAGIGDMSALT